MKLFLSHAHADVFLAKALRIRIEEELSPEVNCFLLADDVLAGEDWEQRIRAAAEQCDGIVSIVTQHYVDRPWFVAEWAVFWFQQKPWYLLLHEVDLLKLFEPMRRRQAFSLEDRRSIQRFLETLAGPDHPRPLDIVASEVKQAIGAAALAQARATAEANLARFVVSLERGTGDVERAVVESIRRAGRLPQAIERACESDNSVALRQLAWILIELDEIESAALLAPRIPNLAERRTVGLACLGRLTRTPDDEAARRLLLEIYQTVRPPQRRDLRSAAEGHGLRVSWPDDEAASEADPSPPDVTVFRDDDRGFFDWLDRHPYGWFLNTERNPNPDDLVLHRPQCHHFNRDPSLQWTRDYIKVGATDRGALERWAAEAVGGKLKLCKSCFG